MDWIDNSLGIHGRALVLRAERAEILAGNVANADTPRYKARDMDFSAAMAQARGESGAGTMRATHSRHLSGGSIESGTQFFRESPRYSPDGNTVQMEVEKAAYVENAVKFQASAQFFDGTLRGIRKALKGE